MRLHPVTLILLSVLCLYACSKEHSCATFEDPEDIEINYVNTVACEDGQRFLMLEANYVGRRPHDCSWSWEIAGYTSDTYQLQVRGNEDMYGHVQFKNNMTDCFIYKEIHIPAGSPSGSAIGNSVWQDNPQGNTSDLWVQDPSDNFMEGIVVELLRAEDASVIARDTTDFTGRYLFMNLPSDTYRVHVIKPDNMSFIPKQHGSDPTEDSDVDAQGYSAPIFLDGCELRLDIDAGLR